MKNVRIVIFEDNDNLRNSLSFLIETTPGFECTGAFPDCSDLGLKLNISKPDIALMDIDMPGMSGIDAVAEIRKMRPECLCIMQTVFDDEDRILNAVCNGASGYILKGTHAGKLIEAIREVLDGGSPMSPGIARKVLRIIAERGDQKIITPEVKLTIREKEVLQELVNGKSYKMIADVLGMALPTVNTHIRKIYEKLQVNSVQQAVAQAIRKGLV